MRINSDYSNRFMIFWKTINPKGKKGKENIHHRKYFFKNENEVKVSDQF